VTSDLVIRRMTPEDIPWASALAMAHGWRDRTRFYNYTLRVPTAHTLVGTLDGQLMATGLGVALGPSGWLGAIAVVAEFRGRGFGRRMTEDLIARMHAAGCQSISLESTAAGKPLYEKLGFRIHSWYIELDPVGAVAEPVPPGGARVRPIEPADLPRVFALDRAATGDDRHDALALLAEEGGWVLEDDSGSDDAAEWHAAAPSLRGFLLPSDRGHGAIVAPRFEDGEFLMRLRAWVAGDGPGPRCAMPDAHGAEIDELCGRGWVVTDKLPRMVLGPDPIWRPTWIWGQINSAMG
jgi:ribosomal protein S18 acetylase RimI-like enzyme